MCDKNDGTKIESLAIQSPCSVWRTNKQTKKPVRFQIESDYLFCDKGNASNWKHLIQTACLHDFN